jgi:YegS/Rv2252/BmrU family lipid kinase
MQIFDSNNLPFDLERTSAPEHAVELARSAARAGYQIVVAVGGDGTANEVLNGLMQAQLDGHNAIMGHVAIGRGNDFAYGAGIPPGLDPGCELLIHGKTKHMDVGIVRGGIYPDGRYFGNGVGVGFDAVVGFEALKMKRLQGFLSYLIAALKTIFLYYQAPRVRLEYDGKTMELNALMVSVMNGRRMGGGFMMAPEAETEDALLDLCIAEQVSKMRVLTLIPKFMAGQQASQPSIRTDRTNSIQITALEGTLPAHADGETLCVEGDQLSIQLLPRKIEIIAD